MSKHNPEAVPSSEVTTVGAPKRLAPAEYKLVGIDPNAKNVHIPLLSREYTITELERLDILEMLHRLGWPHVEKSYKPI